MTISEDIEPESHTLARLMITNAMELNGYEVIPGYYIWPRWTCGNPATRAIAPPEMKDERYKEFDLMCRKQFEYGLQEEIFIDIGTEDDWDTMHSPANSSKYVYKKQKGNDENAEQWLHMLKPDAILIRPSKSEVITFANAPEELFNHIMNLKKKYIDDFISTANAKIDNSKKVIEKTTTKF